MQTPTNEEKINVKTEATGTPFRAKRTTLWQRKEIIIKVIKTSTKKSINPTLYEYKKQEIKK